MKFETDDSLPTATTTLFPYLWLIFRLSSITTPPWVITFRRWWLLIHWVHLYPNWALGCLDTGSPHRTTAEYTSPLPLFLLLEALRHLGIPWHVPCTWPPPSSGLWRSLLTTVFQPLTVDKRLRGDGCFAHCNLNSLTLFSHIPELSTTRGQQSFCVLL